MRNKGSIILFIKDLLFNNTINEARSKNSKKFQYLIPNLWSEKALHITI